MTAHRGGRKNFDKQKEKIFTKERGKKREDNEWRAASDLEEETALWFMEETMRERESCYPNLSIISEKN